MHLNLLKIRIIILKIFDACLILSHTCTGFFDIIQNSFLSSWCSLTILGFIRWIQGTRKCINKFPLLASNLVLEFFVSWIYTRSDISLYAFYHPLSKLLKLLDDNVLACRLIFSLLQPKPVSFLSLFEISLILFKVQSERDIEWGFFTSNQLVKHEFINPLWVFHYTSIFYPQCLIARRLNTLRIILKLNFTEDRLNSWEDGLLWKRTIINTIFQFLKFTSIY